MSAIEASLRASFRKAESHKGGKAISLLSELRVSAQPSDYAVLFGAFRAAAPRTARALCLTGPAATSELVWSRGVLQPLSLQDELCWASHWLSIHASRINRFRQYAVRIQEQVINGDPQAAIVSLDEYVRSAGWSLWAVELRAALLQVSGGTAAQRKWLGDLQAKAPNSVPGLLFAVFGDRNDDTLSYDALSRKCQQSFPRFESLAPWLVDYLKYRALGQLHDITTALPNILCRDITSSLVDYYEDIVDALNHVRDRYDLTATRPMAANLLRAVLSAGYEDHRLKKLAIAFNLNPVPQHIECAPDPRFRALYVGSLARDSETTSLPFNITADLIRCQNEGAAAYEPMGRLLKWGLNFRGLDVGPAVALATLSATSHVAATTTTPFSPFLLSGSFCVDDVVALPVDAAATALVAALAEQGKFVDEKELLTPSRWGAGEALRAGGPILLWISDRMLSVGNLGELDALMSQLASRSPYWERQRAKFAILAAIERGSTDEALTTLEHWYRKSPLYALEMPAAAVFVNTNWADFKHLDPVLVGLVAHREFEARGDSNVSFICKMACRAFLTSGTRNQVAELIDTTSESRKSQVIAFLRDVWVEQNLPMCHQFESTATVRAERMTTIQLLRERDPDRATEYAEAIKDLTFDQTLQLGLERIDQTRVFVNESAINRWAEKELEQDYDRWRKLSDSGARERPVDNMLRQYALNPENVEVLNEFANGKPTAADALLIDLMDRLFKRFLLDPTDGLDTYLSVRIRHGSFKGILLGPLEDNGLLYSTTGFSTAAFSARWEGALRLPAAEMQSLLEMVQEFSVDVCRLVDEFVDQRVQVQRIEKPQGELDQILPPHFARLAASSLAERPPSFHAFLLNCYFVFWKIVEVGLGRVRAHISGTLAPAIHNRIDRLIGELRELGFQYVPLLTALTTASTATKAQCDTVSEWFRLPNPAGSERYEFSEAIKIARVATSNVDRRFSAEISVRCLPIVRLPLTISGLAVLMDCLFVVFENAWKHSGLSYSLRTIDLYAHYDPAHQLLTLTCRSPLSKQRLRDLGAGELERLRRKYLGELPLDLISREGGSGFPKLARLARAVSIDACPSPFNFGIDGTDWFTRVTIPLYCREGAFEAYE